MDHDCGFFKSSPTPPTTSTFQNNAFLGKPFQPRVMFAGKDKRLPKKGKRWPYSQTLD
jgi:hypothetical protein